MGHGRRAIANTLIEAPLGTIPASHPRHAPLSKSQIERRATGRGNTVGRALVDSVYRSRASVPDIRAHDGAIHVSTACTTATQLRWRTNFESLFESTDIRLQ